MVGNGNSRSPLPRTSLVSIEQCSDDKSTKDDSGVQSVDSYWLIVRPITLTRFDLGSASLDFTKGPSLDYSIDVFDCKVKIDEKTNVKSNQPNLIILTRNCAFCNFPQAQKKDENRNC